jgi:hypothetical protein
MTITNDASPSVSSPDSDLIPIKVLSRALKQDETTLIQEIKEGYRQGRVIDGAWFVPKKEVTDILTSVGLDFVNQQYSALLEANPDLSPLEALEQMDDFKPHLSRLIHACYLKDEASSASFMSESQLEEDIDAIHKEVIELMAIWQEAWDEASHYTPTLQSINHHFMRWIGYGLVLILVLAWFIPRLNNNMLSDLMDAPWFIVLSIKLYYVVKYFIDAEQEHPAVAFIKTNAFLIGFFLGLFLFFHLLDLDGYGVLACLFTGGMGYFTIKHGLLWGLSWINKFKPLNTRKDEENRVNQLIMVYCASLISLGLVVVGFKDFLLLD